MDFFYHIYPLRRLPLAPPVHVIALIEGEIAQFKFFCLFEIFFSTDRKSYAE